MRIESLYLENFRNYKTSTLDLKNYQQIALIGFNAQGKSNLLESLYVLAFASSFRMQQNQLTDLIYWGKDQAKCEGLFKNQQGTSFQLSFSIRQNGKRLIQHNYHYLKRLGDFIGQIKLVLFASRDLHLISGQPSQRRQFIDLLLIQSFPGYFYTLQNYKKVLKQRNHLLKMLKGHYQADKIDQLEAWDQQLSQFGADLIYRRFKAVEKLKVYLKQYHAQMSGLSENINLVYQTCIDEVEGCSQTDIAAQLFKQFSQKQAMNIQRGQTTVGPHRDELLFYCQERELKLFGSQGQLRTAVLSLKLAELAYLNQIFNEPPLLLLDDVFSELDLKRQQALLQCVQVPGIQTLLTTTHLDDMIQNFFQADSLILHVNEGEIHPYEAF